MTNIDPPSRSSPKLSDTASNLAPIDLNPRKGVHEMTSLRRLPACSVVIPGFNAAKTIRATIDSARAQSVDDIEIIVVDDGSHDQTPDIVAAMASADPRIVLIRQANGGVSVARNTGISAAQSRAIAFLDADDIWHRDHIAVHINRLRAMPRLGVSFSPARFIDEQGQVVGRSQPKLANIAPVDILHSNPTTTCSTMVVRREIFKDVGLFRTDMRHNEDQEWLFRVSLSGWTMAGDPIARVDYRTNPRGLASDLDGMYRGFETMLVEAAKRAPVLVRRNAVRARANMQRYLARRAIRLELEPHIARTFILQALRTCPSLLLREPRATIPTLVAALTPRALIAPVLHYVRPQSVHA